MEYQTDPEFISQAGPILESFAALEQPPLHDIAARRVRAEGYRAFFSGLPEYPDWAPKKFTTTSNGGRNVDLYWFANKSIESDPKPGSAIVHFHGGGYVTGYVSIFEKLVASQAATANVPILSVDYRLAPESTGTELVHDCYAGLVWLRDNANSLNIDAARIGVMGESAGGGLAAGVALLARDQNISPPLAKQILVYPMIDDRNTTKDERIDRYAVWNNADNITGWTAVLGEDVVGTDHGNTYAAPARATDLTGLPSTYIDVGELDIFREEALEYARKLSAAGVWVEFHLHPGVPHGFELLAPQSSVAKRALADRLRACKSF